MMVDYFLVDCLLGGFAIVFVGFALVCVVYVGASCLRFCSGVLVFDLGLGWFGYGFLGFD